MSSLTLKAAQQPNRLAVATWNIAAVNNNPFEYWITMKDNPAYNKMMNDVELFIESPDEHDISVSQVFTSDMYNQLEKSMQSIGRVSSSDLAVVKKLWTNDYSQRKIVSGFLKDTTFGKKRLASMPDRITNTINVATSDSPVCRPTVINMYEGDLSTIPSWFTKWHEFMFNTPLTLIGSSTPQNVYNMLQPILASKYPAITPEEEAVSVPLQVVACAIFDAILVHMLNVVSGPEVWQPMKSAIVTSLNKQKTPSTLNILNTQYSNMDIICLQEVSAAFIQSAENMATLASKFWVVKPAALDSKRDQNSVILLSKVRFPGGSLGEITELVKFPQGVKVPVAKGDILAIKTKDAQNVDYVVASFHGDTNGLATIPVVTALQETMKEGSNGLENFKLVFGLDANTYEKGTIDKKGAKEKQDVMEFGVEYVKLGLTSNFGDKPIRDNFTTFNARTYLQPQLNKACKSSEKRECGDVNPKDFILFKRGDWDVVGTGKDNTGKGEYLEDTPFPTLEWPSDHGLLWGVLERAEES